jgi:3',5'-cyclic AMP phosphodiesterase CpdA
MRTFFFTALVWLPIAAFGQASGGFRFAVIGDTGTGGRAQREVADRLDGLRREHPFDTVLMLGDNLYGGQTPADFRAKFERPYAALLSAGVQFFAVLGNHDQPSQQAYAAFHMGGRNYYSFQPAPNVRFVGLDSNRMDQAQLKWLESELMQAPEDWKIVFFHHPIYSSGARHGSDLALRRALEPLFIKHGVTLALAGHDHVYERIKPQHGVHYFVAGGAAKLRAGNVRKSDITAQAFDTDQSFLMMEIHEGQLHFQAVSRTGQTVDAGVIPKRP